MWLPAAAQRWGHLLKPTGEEYKVEQTNDFWADVITVAASPVAIAAGVAKGSYDAASGNGPFREGFNATAEPILWSAKKFGAQHGTTITKGIIGGAAGALGARLISETFKHLRI
jgi:hypothetical protein